MYHKLLKIPGRYFQIQELGVNHLKLRRLSIFYALHLHIYNHLLSGSRFNSELISFSAADERTENNHRNGRYSVAIHVPSICNS